MTTITYDEFLKLPMGIRTKDLIPGIKYYIRNGVRRTKKQIDVYLGVFRNEDQDDKIFYFDDVKQIVKPIGTSKASGFGRSGWIYTEALPTSPTEEDREKKNLTIKELNDFIQEKRAEPHDEPPSVSFAGEDYREAKKTFKNKSKRLSRGGKSNKRKTLARR